MAERSLTIDVRALKRMASIVASPNLKSQIDSLRGEKAVAALMGQAIADNFAQEGPGWAPLKASTIRQSVSKKIAKSIAHMSDKELLEYERKARRKESTDTPHRAILQKTRLLYKTATIPGYTGSSRGKKPITGGNIYKVEGTKIIWGTNLVYAATHQHGDPKRNIPARPFLDITPTWQSRIQDYFISRVLKLIRQIIREANQA